MASQINTQKEACEACGAEFDTLAEVFSHDCAGDVPSAKWGQDRQSSPLARGPRASEKQVAFLVRLGVTQAEAEQMSKTTASKTIDKLLKTQGGPKISEKQEAFLRKLVAERVNDLNDDADTVIDTLNTLPKPSHGASALIDTLLKQPRKPKPTDPVKGDVHFIDGEYYRVHQSQGSGNFYASKWDGYRFEYAQGAIRKLNADNKITAEQAAEFGHMHGRCCFCSLAIDTPESTAVGYGPICASKHGLPWG